ncbi:MAG: hypothetical protein J3K34DRAFT_430541 [Monoraphidium minutum]|nr:MAG: hypothetical protein J3K34DRAFT_430541 [Monoraphidium minutum]
MPAFPLAHKASRRARAAGARQARAGARRGFCVASARAIELSERKCCCGAKAADPRPRAGNGGSAESRPTYTSNKAPASPGSHTPHMRIKMPRGAGDRCRARSGFSRPADQPGGAAVKASWPLRGERGGAERGSARRAPRRRSGRQGQKGGACRDRLRARRRQAPPAFACGRRPPDPARVSSTPAPVERKMDTRRGRAPLD